MRYFLRKATKQSASARDAQKPLLADGRFSRTPKLASSGATFSIVGLGSGDLIGLAWSGIRFLTRMSCWPSAVIRKIPMKLRPRLFPWMSPSTRGGASWIWWNFCLSSRRVVRESSFSSTMACLRSRQVIVQALP